MPSEERIWTAQLADSHPGAHGPLRLRLRLDGDGRITWAEPLIYPLHRGVEKLFESRDYRQALMLVDRHDWHSAFGSELSLALTIEAMACLAVPARATWVRTMLAELNRVIHHLRWLGETLRELARAGGRSDQLAAARAAREALIDVHEAVTGGRLHPMYLRPGGLRADLPAGWGPRLTDAAAAARLVLPGLRRELDEAEPQLRGVAVLDRDSAIAFGASGPVARAAGLELDLRFDDPYCAYPALEQQGVLRRVTHHSGDAFARLLVLADELPVSLDCLQACARELNASEGEPVNVRLPRSLRLPQGRGYGWAETPTGINGCYLDSRGGTEPYRLRLRTASFGNAQAMSHALPGTRLDQLPAALMSFFLVAGDLAK